MITLDYLKTRVELTEEKDFVFRWLKIENPHKYSSFNSNHAGNLAGSMREDGYIIVNFEGYGRYFLHRLAYMYYNNIPAISLVPDVIDYIDLDTRNNLADNLRDGTGKVKNQRNRKGIGACGYKGVSFSDRTGNYRARIVVNNREVNLKTSKCIQPCIEFYKAACVHLNYPVPKEYTDVPDIKLPERVIDLIDKAFSYTVVDKQSQYVGVGWNKKQGKWNAIVVVKGGNKCVGSFDCDMQAALARDKFIKENNLSAPLSLS